MLRWVQKRESAAAVMMTQAVYSGTAPAHFKNGGSILKKWFGQLKKMANG